MDTTSTEFDHNCRNQANAGMSLAQTYRSFTSHTHISPLSVTVGAAVYGIE
jgi:hypothetical protein